MTDDDILEMRAKLKGSLLFFTQFFYHERTGRDFDIPIPSSAEPHPITICKAFTKAFRLDSTRLIINCPPGWGKSELCRHFVAWCVAHYPDSNFIYVSFSKERALENTAYIKQIIELPIYRKIFGIELDPNDSSKGHFKTKQGGTIVAFGSEGAVVGADGGLPGLDRFSGAVIMDDMHKPQEIHSETMRNYVITNYKETISKRPRSTKVPLIFIGQRLHEEDLPGQLLRGLDGHQWDKVILTALDEHDNVNNPMKDSKENLLLERKYNEYTFWAQEMQNPQPSGGGIFKVKNFCLLEKRPHILATFITCDTAESENEKNDATVLSLFGIYKIDDDLAELDQYALHWMDCRELRVEPDQLENEFLDFWVHACRQGIPPNVAYIEKKSTGVTLYSVMSKRRGLNVIPIERTKASGNKISRFLRCQPYVSKGLVSLDSQGHLWSVQDNKQINLCIEHCRKITLNNSHRHDDIADTMADAIFVGLIDKQLDIYSSTSDSSDALLKELVKNHYNTNRLRERAYGSTAISR
jgi:predicted phage terminase large subunit-like protein